MFWNSEHYPDPTAGQAIANIIREERRNRRAAARRKKAAEDAERRKQEAAERTRCRPSQPKPPVAQKRPTIWIKAWPKDNAGEGGSSK